VGRAKRDALSYAQIECVAGSERECRKSTEVVVFISIKWKQNEGVAGTIGGKNVIKRGKRRKN